MPELSARELKRQDILREIARLEDELESIRADNNMEHFPDPASIGIRRAPEEVKAYIVELYETKIAGLRIKSER